MQVIIIQAIVSTKVVPPYMGVTPIYGVPTLLREGESYLFCTLPLQASIS